MAAEARREHRDRLTDHDDDVPEVFVVDDDVTSIASAARSSSREL